MALGSVQNRVCVACCFTRSFSGLRWSSMAVGGFLSCYFISRLLITASYQFNLVNGGGFYFSFESIYSLLPKLFSVWHGIGVIRWSVIRFSEVTNVEVVLRGSFITSASGVWSSTHPSAIKLRLDFCGCVVTFSAGIGGNLIWWWRWNQLVLCKAVCTTLSLEALLGKGF